MATGGYEPPLTIEIKVSGTSKKFKANVADIIIWPPPLTRWYDSKPVSAPPAKYPEFVLNMGSDQYVGRILDYFKSEKLEDLVIPDNHVALGRLAFISRKFEDYDLEQRILEYLKEFLDTLTITDHDLDQLVKDTYSIESEAAIQHIINLVVEYVDLTKDAHFTIMAKLPHHTWGYFIYRYMLKKPNCAGLSSARCINIRGNLRVYENFYDSMENPDLVKEIEWRNSGSGTGSYADISNSTGPGDKWIYTFDRENETIVNHIKFVLLDTVPYRIYMDYYQAFDFYYVACEKEQELFLIAPMTPKQIYVVSPSKFRISNITCDQIEKPKPVIQIKNRFFVRPLSGEIITPYNARALRKGTEFPEFFLNDSIMFSDSKKKKELRIILFQPYACTGIEINAVTDVGVSKLKFHLEIVELRKLETKSDTMETHVEKIGEFVTDKPGNKISVKFKRPPVLKEIIIKGSIRRRLKERHQNIEQYDFVAMRTAVSPIRLINDTPPPPPPEK